MFFHLFKYRLKNLIRSKSMIFWTMVFPLVLATFFSLAFSSLNEHENFNAIHIGIVKDAMYEQHTDFQSVMKEMSEGDDAMFSVQTGTKEEVEALLSEGKIEGYVQVEDAASNALNLVVSKSEINQSIIKIFLDQYKQMSSAVGTILVENPAAMEVVFQELGNEGSITKEVAASSAKPNNILSYFYSLIAMTCLYGSFFGLQEVIQVQANLSAHAARVGLSPVHKLKAFLAGISASVLIHYTEVLILIAYLHFGLGIDFGTKTAVVLFTAFIGSIVGISFGAFISALVKGNESMKTGICIAASMFGSFLAGMMFEGMKYTVDSKFPMIAKLNPVGVLTDSFYALYYYDSYDRYLRNLVNLVVFSVVFCGVTYSVIRRQKYASI